MAGITVVNGDYFVHNNVVVNCGETGFEVIGGGKIQFDRNWSNAPTMLKADVIGEFSAQGNVHTPQRPFSPSRVRVSPPLEMERTPMVAALAKAYGAL